MHAVTLLSAAAAALVATVVSPAAAATPTPPKLVYIASANLTIPPPVDLGVTPQGSRAILPITAGTVWGDRLSGTSDERSYPGSRSGRNPDAAKGGTEAFASLSCLSHSNGSLDANSCVLLHQQARSSWVSTGA